MCSLKHDLMDASSSDFNTKCSSEVHTHRGVPRIFLWGLFKIFLEPFRRLEKVDERGGGGGGGVRVIFFSIMDIGIGRTIQNIHSSKKVTQHDFDRLYILDLYSSSLTSLESLFICLSIDALFVRVISLGRVQGE